MSAPVITVGEATQAAEIARLLVDCRIKRVPVIRDGRIVDIVSRADLVRALASGQREETAQEQGGFLSLALASIDRPFEGDRRSAIGSASSKSRPAPKETGLTA